MAAETTNIVVFVTSVNVEEARKVSSMLMAEKKVACVNIVREVESMFWWQDKIETTQESLLIIKTSSTHLEDIVKMVKQVHSYDVPEVIALPIIGGSEDYLKWMNTTVNNGDHGD
jgi:periplasmic divalent cation tolerance protein